MSGYSPVLTGETPELRQEIESIFTTSEDAVLARLTELDIQAQQLNTKVTFGAEVEATFIPNPNDPRSAGIDEDDIDMDSLYEEVVYELLGPKDSPMDSWEKGMVIMPEDNPEPVMLSPRRNGTYNPDLGQWDMIEIRTAPANAVEAVKRYWDTIRAIGIVAERHGFMGIVLGTHINAAVFKDDEHGDDFVNFISSPEGGRILAAVQHNLNAMNPLQLDTGLQTGVSVLEAYPHNKNASTAVHHFRLEIRHPTVGIADPRVDMLAVLEGVNREALGQLSAVEMDALHNCSPVDASFEVGNSLGDIRSLIDFNDTYALWDHRSRKFVMPALLQKSAGADIMLNDLTYKLTGRTEYRARDDNARAVRRALGSLSIGSRKNLRLRGRDAKDNLRPLANNVDLISKAEIGFSRDKYRVEPKVIYDSPEAHAVQRANIARSSAVRRIMGAAIATLTPARDALKWRREIIENTMVDETEDLIAA